MQAHDSPRTDDMKSFRGLERALRREELDGSSPGRLQGGQAAQKRKEEREHGSVLSITIDTQCKDTKKGQGQSKPAGCYAYKTAC